MPPGRDDEYVYGVLNIVKALTADVPPLEPIQTPVARPSTTTTQAQSPKGDTNTLVIGGIVLLVLLAAVSIGGSVWHRARR
jgi:hypothetical protein